MKKIKSVKLAKDYRDDERETLKGTILLKEENGNGWLMDGYYYSVKDIENNNTRLFQIEYESEHFELVVPSFEELDKGYVSLATEIIPAHTCDKEFLENNFFKNRWFKTEETAEKHLIFNRCKVYCNKLREKCERENEEDKIATRYRFYLNGGIFRVLADYTFEYGFKFSSRKSAEQFLKECSPEMLETLKEMYECKELI